MMLPASWNGAWTAAIANHLWQSTAVTAIAWLLTLCLRNNHARTRYWVWMIASVKYLIPFSLLITAGESLHSAFRFGIEQIFATSMQAVSGAGYPGVASMDILDNVVPYIANEEEKMEEGCSSCWAR